MDAFRRVRNNNQKGFALVYIALMVVVLFAFVGLAVDMGHMYLTKGQLQNAADSGALAGVSQLPNVTVARQTAKQFTERNKAAGETAKVDLNTTNSANGDIVVGYWDKKTRKLLPVVPFGKVANAVKVMTRRTSEAGTGISTDNKPVDSFFAQVMNWDTMAARAEAIACRPPKPSAPIVLCQSLCGVTTFPFKVYFNQTKAVDPAGVANPLYTVGWTEFSATSKATELGPNGTVAKLIKDPDHEIPLGLCGETLWTNNGLGKTIDILRDAYLAERDPSTKIWTVLVPIFEVCPSSVSWGESFTKLVEYAEIDLIEVKTTAGGGEAYAEIQRIDCQGCSTASFLGSKATLVK
ncbi:Tad domain-containing protein [Geomonas paludis]|uniref:Tad domain-containing protein n=1 Tax=Geomonas paludis TaxID=2740185 RepID=A0A6V8MXR3_9BACT|nr:TadE/TadG family type IV pilus assembly protein [Geomonas paludis]UPU34330.1 Tad domain-containing protein [Geomonas paludis]GFO64313.1 hypothetical protein GMPD_22320 [Geomonas paludis]